MLTRLVYREEVSAVAPVKNVGPLDGCTVLSPPPWITSVGVLWLLGMLESEPKDLRLLNHPSILGAGVNLHEGILAAADARWELHSPTG